MPDLYQGTEYWDFSLVDPDNRRPVDFEAREASLKAAEPPTSLLGTWRDGRVKQAILARALAFRASASALFTEGSYTPLSAEGPAADRLLAFARVHEGRAAIVVVSRFTAKLAGMSDWPLPGSGAWKGTDLLIPRSLAGRQGADVLGGMDGPLPGRLPIAEILGSLPVALLEVK